MSMPTWLSDPSTFANNENGSLNTTGDPSLAFMQTPTTSSFDFNQFQNQQLQQRMQNGVARNRSPASLNAMYQTQTTIPSKRPRPREGSIGASPRQYPGTLPASRSQTPQAIYPGYQGAMNGGPQFSGVPYQPFQQTNNNVSQSPVMANQTFNAQPPQQRLSTMSPSPFSPAVQNFGTQPSPQQSEHGSRVNTPQSGGQPYTGGVPYGGAVSQSFSPTLDSAVNGGPLSQYGQHPQTNSQQQQQHLLQQQQQKLYEATRMRRMQQASVQQRQQLGSQNPTPNYQQMAQIRAQHAQQGQQPRPNNPDQLLKQIQAWMQHSGLPFNSMPVAAGRPINCVALFITVMKQGGSKKVTAASQWPSVAATFGVPPPQCLSGGQDLQIYWHTNMSGYETFCQTAQQHQQRQRALGNSRAPGHMESGDATMRQDPFSPVKQMHNQQAQQLMQPPSQSQAQYQMPSKQMGSQQQNAHYPLQNGYMTAEQAQAQVRQSNDHNFPPPALHHTPRTTPSRTPNNFPSVKKEAQHVKSKPKKNGLDSLEGRHSPLMEYFVPRNNNLDVEGNSGAIENAEVDKGAENKSKNVPAKHHGGLSISDPHFLATIDDLLKYKLSVPKLEELGIVDIRALILSLRSRIQAEVRLALDTIASLSTTKDVMSLNDCEDLVEALIDCAEVQVELLAEYAAEVSDAMLVNSYEEVMRGCRVENGTLQDIPEFGTLEYDLDRAVDRLICITTILRNFSLSEHSHQALSEPIVIQMMTTVIRYLGTRNMFLRTYLNTLDFSKDVVVFLSNVCHNLDLTTKEEALCLLHFLVSFAPMPEPNDGDALELAFPPYIPSLHRYLPLAVDSLAKMLARGDPNRSFFRSIVSADNTSCPPYDLLTCAFGLAIASIPEVGDVINHRTANPLAIVAIRSAYVAQGLLAADILTSLIPSTDRDLARSWLASKDGFASKLARIISLLARRQQNQPPRARGADSDPNGFDMVMRRGLAVLKKLAEKSKDTNGTTKELPPGVLPDKNSVLLALSASSMDSSMVRQFCASSGLDN